MTAYSAPVAEILFAIEELADLRSLAALPGFEEVSSEMVAAILDEAGRLGREVLAPLNRPGDIQGSVLENGLVRTPAGFADAYRRFVDGGWNGVPFDPAHGGQGLPWAVATAVAEIWNSANMSFALCPMLTQGAVELLSAHASAALKARFLPNLVKGTWTGTMNLTEPGAGSDLARVRCRAERGGDGYRIIGQKIFITYGDHDLAENIVHMVLARLPDAPAGTKGISVFAVPKFLVGDDGRPGRRNDVRCVSLEHKLGIRASPTGVMSYGDEGGAVGYLVGEENRGIECMFTMMNNARLAVGLQGVAIAERALQQARAYARERVQGRAIAGPDPGTGGDAPVAIDRHPDVRRMLLAMAANTEAARALAYFAAAQGDIARRHPDPRARAEAQARADLLTPVVKAWGSDVGIAVADLGIQVHGGMGYIEETGAAQHLRDARVAAIYEGTNGIQAMDLVGRKVARDGGAAADALIARMRADADAPGGTDGDDLDVIHRRLRAGLDALRRATRWVAASFAERPAAVAAGAAPYLRLFGIVAGGWMMARAARAARARAGDPAFAEAKARTARFFADHELVQADSLAATVVEGSAAVTAPLP